MGRRSYGSGSLILKEGCKNYIAVFWQNGKQIQRSTHTSKKMVAEARLRQYLGNVALGIALPSGKLPYEEIREALIADYKRKGNRSLVEHKAADGTVTHTIR